MVQAKQLKAKKGAPAYMVSFGDMMTLILCFFILLVSMGQKQNFGLMAKGVGSFIVAIQSHGLNGIMSGHEKEHIFKRIRRKFNLPPEEDPERREKHIDASNLELIRADLLKALAPHEEITQPRVALFANDSAELTNDSRAYLDKVAETLRPRLKQVLLLEGHSLDAGANFHFDDRWLAFSRASAVGDYLIKEHGFRSARVEPRAWLTDVHGKQATPASVDARLIIPTKED